MPFIYDASSSGSDQGVEQSQKYWSIVSDEDYAARGFPGSNEKPLSQQLEPIAVIGMVSSPEVD